MSVSVIEGKVVEAEIKVRRKKFVRFAHVEFLRSDGRTQRIAKAITTNEVADLLAPGAEGRFYTYKTIDISGVAGVRLTDGQALYEYPGNNMKTFAILIPLALAWIALRIFTAGEVPFLGLIMLVLGTVGFITTRNTINGTKQQFDADAGAPSAPRPAADVAPSTAE